MKPATFQKKPKIHKARALILCLLPLLLLPDCRLLRHYYKAPAPPKSGLIVIKGLGKDVTVRRDALGTPYIEARNEEDLFCAAGYVMANDRLWQMVAMKMVMQGRLAEIVGKDMLKLDVFMRSLNVKHFVDRAMKDFTPRSRRILESFSRGVNTYMATCRELPPEFSLTGYKPEPWSPEDCLYVFAMLNINVSFNFLEELHFLILAGKLGYKKAAYLFPVYPDEELPFEEAEKLKDIPADRLLGDNDRIFAAVNSLQKLLPVNYPASNNWALAGSRTVGGRPIIANDTHLALMIPNSWMILHLKCPTYEAAGVAVPGIPLVTLGYNGKLAWGVTMVMADSQDIFIEKMKREGKKTLYLYKGKWQPVATRSEVFRMKGGKKLTLEMSGTVHGPLLNEGLKRLGKEPEMEVQPLEMESSYGIALTWAVEDGAGTFEGFYDLAKGSTMKEARKAISRINSIYLNFIYGDRKSIAWQVSGKYPIRKRGKGYLPSPGWDGAYDWKGFVPFNAQPHSENPAAGYLVTANHRTVKKGYPHLLSSSWYAPERAQRIAQVLSKLRKGTFEDMNRLHFDRHSLLAERMRDKLAKGPLAEKIRSLIPADRDRKRAERVREALEFLAPGRFDANLTAESAPTAVYGALTHCLAREIFLDELGPEDSHAWEAFVQMNLLSYSALQDHMELRHDSPFFDDIRTPQKEGAAEIFYRALDGSMQLCRERMGRNRSCWRWGRLHTYHWKHEFTRKVSFLKGYLNRGPYPAGGDNSTVNVAGVLMGKDFEVHLIPAMRMIVDFNREEPATLVSVPGQSGHPSSPHYEDMIPLFLKGQTSPLPFKAGAVRQQYTSVLTLRGDK